MYDKSYTYTYRTGMSEGPILGNHMHIYYEFLQLIEGNALYNVEGTEYEISSGDLLITNPNEFHFITFPKKSVYHRQFLQIHSSFVSSMNPHILDTLNVRKFGTNNRIPAEIFNKYNLGDIFKGVEHYSANPTDDTDFMVSTYAAQLVVKLSEILKKEFLVNDTSSKNKHIKEIQNYIEQNFTRNLNIDDIAEHMFLNKSYISRLFKSETGLTISVYINMRRVMMAKNLLLAGENAMDIFINAVLVTTPLFIVCLKNTPICHPNNLRKSTQIYKKRLDSRFFVLNIKLVYVLFKCSEIFFC